MVPETFVTMTLMNVNQYFLVFGTICPTLFKICDIFLWKTGCFFQELKKKYGQAALTFCLPTACHRLLVLVSDLFTRLIDWTLNR